MGSDCVWFWTLVVLKLTCKAGSWPVQRCTEPIQTWSVQLPTHIAVQYLQDAPVQLLQKDAFLRRKQGLVVKRAHTTRHEDYRGRSYSSVCPHVRPMYTSSALSHVSIHRTTLI